MNSKQRRRLNILNSYHNVFIFISSLLLLHSGCRTEVINQKHQEQQQPKSKWGCSCTTSEAFATSYPPHFGNTLSHGESLSSFGRRGKTAIHLLSGGGNDKTNTHTVSLVTSRLRGGSNATLPRASLEDTSVRSLRSNSIETRPETSSSDLDEYGTSFNGESNEPISTRPPRIRKILYGPSFRMKSSSSATAAAKTENENVVEDVKDSIKKAYDSLNQEIKEKEDQLYPCEMVAETNLPTDIGLFRLRAYRVQDVNGFQKFTHNLVGAEPCVIYAADKPPCGPNGELGEVRDFPVRVHDQCFTSEVFRSQRCDCKEQLKLGLEMIRDNGGAIIYLQQEGRGIGIANKIAAYALQDGGMDTVDANLHLGLPEDARQYGVVPSILEDLNIKSIRLMTNNPRKVKRMRDLGVDVSGTIPVVVEANEFNRKYIKTKVERMNHKNFGDMLSLDNMKPPPNEELLVSSALNEVMLSNVKTGKSQPVAETYINDGEELAAAAVTSALYDLNSDSDFQEGVTARSDGYCFGRESVEEAITAMARGEIVVVVDDMDRENEGDFIMAADKATPETIATIVRYSSGVICVGMEGDRMDELKLPAMLTNNEDPKGTAFSVTVDASEEHGITTGISAADRAKTIQLLANAKATATDFCRPGHIFPLRGRKGGVLERDGHTEASIDLSRLAGCSPNGVLCEIVSEENPAEMARLPELKRFCKKHGYVLTSIVDIAQYRRDTE